MNQLKQVITVTLWEYRRFYKPRNELAGIAVMIFVMAAGYFLTRYAGKSSGQQVSVAVESSVSANLKQLLAASFSLTEIPDDSISFAILHIQNTKNGLLLQSTENGYLLHGWKIKDKDRKLLAGIINQHTQTTRMEAAGISADTLGEIFSPVELKLMAYQKSRGPALLAFFFAGMMLLGVFLSFAYQFTAITGEKQLRITEQIVSAIKPQVWMDGKILGITLTGLSSMASYTLIGILGGMLYFLFTKQPMAQIMDYLYFPAIILFFVFMITGILLWNAMLAGIAAIITDPNNSGKSSLMMVPLLFVLTTFLVMRDPDSGLAFFLSWFPFTSATAAPMRWIATEVPVWDLMGSYILLAATFMLMRKIAAKIFRVSILVSGKEPGWAEIYRCIKESR